MITPHTLYMFRFELPDGVHIATHRTVLRPKTSEEVKALHEQISKAIMQNPDAVIDWNSLKAVKDPNEIEKAVEALRKENPSRPLAQDLGLDATNRLLTNPEVARTIAAANNLESDLNP